MLAFDFLSKHTVEGYYVIIENQLKPRLYPSSKQAAILFFICNVRFVCVE